MKISKEDLQEFKQIYKSVYGKEITDSEAYDSGNALLNLFRVALLEE